MEGGGVGGSLVSFAPIRVGEFGAAEGEDGVSDGELGGGEGGCGH